MSNSKWSSESASRFYISSRITGPNNPLGITGGTEFIDGRHSMHRLLARDGFSAVFLAHDGLRPHDVALQIARIPDCDPKIARAAPQHELQMYMKIGVHPHVLRVYGLCFNSEEVGERSDERTLREVIL